MGFAEFGTNTLNWANKIGANIDSVLNAATPFLDLYAKGNQIAQQFKNAGKPPRSNADASIVPGQIPTNSQLQAIPPAAMSQTNGNLPLIAIGAGLVLLVLLKK